LGRLCRRPDAEETLVRELSWFQAVRTTLEPVTAFLVPNSAGKTSALHAIRLACDAVTFALESDVPAKVDRPRPEDWITLTSGALVGDHTRLLPLADWRALFVDQNVGEGLPKKSALNRPAPLRLRA
jgi:hypothetical protein